MRSVTNTALAAIFATVVGLGTGAAAQDAPAPDAALAEIREMALYARYREARVAVNAYLERIDLTAAQRNAGLEVLATIQIAMRDTAGARVALEQLYSRDPGHQLTDPDASPPVLSAFGRARANPPPLLEVGLVHTPPTFTERQPPVIEVDLGVGRDAVDELRLRYRQGDDTNFTTVVMNIDDRGVATARLPVLDRIEEYAVEYYVEALSPSGRILQSRGTEAEPLSFTMPEGRAGTFTGGGGGGSGETDTPRPPEDFTGLAIGLVVAAVVLAGGIVATYFIVQEVSGPTDGSLGNVALPLLRF